MGSSRAKRRVWRARLDPAGWEQPFWRRAMAELPALHQRLRWPLLAGFADARRLGHSDVPRARGRRDGFDVASSVMTRVEFGFNAHSSFFLLLQFARPREVFVGKLLFSHFAVSVAALAVKPIAVGF